MDSIVVKHIIDESKITINFNLSDGSLSYPSIELKTDGDIDLYSLVVKLTELIEKKRILHFEYKDENLLLETNQKMQLVKGTLDEIYSVFNTFFNNSENSGTQSHFVQNSDDLPF